MSDIVSYLGFCRYRVDETSPRFELGFPHSVEKFTPRPSRGETSLKIGRLLPAKDPTDLTTFDEHGPRFDQEENFLDDEVRRKAILSIHNKSQNEITNLAKGASITLLGKIGGRGFQALGQILLARMLGPELFGLYALGWTILNIGALIASLGLHNGVIHFGAQYWHHGIRTRTRLIDQSVGYSIVVGSILGIGLFIFAPALSEHVFREPELAPVLRGFGFAFPLVAGLRVSAAATRISERMEYSVYSEDLIQPLSNLIFLLILFILGAKLIPSVISLVVSFGIALLLALYYVGKVFGPKPVSIPLPEINTQQLLSYSGVTTFGSLFIMLIMWVDRLLVGFYLSVADVGIYQVASQTAMFFGIVLTSFNTIFSPMIARLFHAGDIKQLGEMYKISTKWGLYLSLPFFIVVFFASEQVMTVIYGKEYGVGWLPLLILSGAQLINAGTGAVGFMLTMTGHPKRWAIIAALILVYNIVLNIFLIPKMGITGAAIATATSVIALFVIGLLQVRNIIGLWPYDRRYLKGCGAIVLTILAILLIGQFPIPNLLYLILITVTSILVFTVGLLMLGLDEEDKKIISIGKEKLLVLLRKFILKN